MNKSIVFLFLTLIVLHLEAQTITVVYNETYEPFSFVHNNQIKGLEIDIMNEIAKRAGLNVVHKAFPWVRAQLMVKNGEADIFITTSTPERETYAVMSTNGIFTITNTAVTSRKNPRIELLRTIRSIEDADKFKQVNYLGTGIANTLLKNANVNYISTTDSIFKFLLSNRADIYIESDVNIMYNASRFNIQNQLDILPVKFNSVAFRLGISKKSSLLNRVEDLNKIIGTMISDGTINSIFKSYGVSYK